MPCLLSSIFPYMKEFLLFHILADCILNCGKERLFPKGV